MLKSIGFLNLSTTGHKITTALAYPLILSIYLYRFILAPIYGNSCRYYPSCSHYAEEALIKYGAYRGSIMTIKRLLRCHPWHEGGYDPVD